MNNTINYIELYTNDIEKCKTFYNSCFNWKFTDYGPTYSSFENSGVAGGFEQTDQPPLNGALIVIHHKNLESCRELVKRHGGEITVDIFTFPGGRRFQFKDPTGIEMAVWTQDSE